MPITPIGKPNLTPDQVHTISQAATTLASLEHYLRHGSVYDRKWSKECMDRVQELESIIELDRRQHTVAADTEFPQ